MNSSNQPAGPAADDDLPPAGNGRKQLLIGGGIAAGLAVVAGLAFVLLTGGDDSAPSGVVAGARDRAATAGPSGKATGKPTGPVTGKPTASGAIKTYSGKNGKDPFAPLVVEAAASGDATAGSTAASGAAATGAASTGAATTGSSAGKPAKAQTVKMLSISGSSASLSVDSAKQQVKLGATFAKYYKLLALSDNKQCGIIQYGDVTVELCEGKSVRIF
jgi:hypothetical protein